MGSNMFHSPETGTLRAVPTFELQFVPVRDSSVLQFPHANEDADARDGAPGCIRGIRFALVIEAAAAIMIYAIWHLSHLSHLVH